MLCAHARREWLTLATATLLLTAAAAIMTWWITAALILLIGLAGVLSFRDPDRQPPSQRGVVVAPADGRIASIHEAPDLDTFDTPTLCIRTFLSLFNVHVVRMPCYGRIAAIHHRDGKHLSALNPASAEENQAITLILNHPTRDEPVAAVRLIAGQFARTIRLFVTEGQTLQRGQRLGIILLGSTAECYLPNPDQVRPLLETGAKVRAAESIIAEPIRSPHPATTSTPTEPASKPAEPTAPPPEPQPIEAS
ncbi:phosphatidylserine decarboxylase [Mucisphaera sp.]|uniref:phosphatidylserine decarboxylase n=1 Tax=Mucisphaera sp. TaxID=2913024 RepID=UPI003D14582F